MVSPYVCVYYLPITLPLLCLVLFAMFIIILSYEYGRVTASMQIQYPGILLGEGYN
jgi:hypothetical protein